MYSRFMREISGELDKALAASNNTENDHYWENMAKKKAVQQVEEADRDATVDENGVIRWKCNGCCLMDDFCEILEYMGYDFSREETSKARDIENARSIEEYRKERANEGYTAEERFEMQSAFGIGTTVVDILSGLKSLFRM